MTIKVLYIIGAGSSGSTLLGKILGAHSKMINVGEISHIDRYRALDLTCGCGERLSQCPFWNQIFDSNASIFPVKPNNTFYRFFRYRSDCIRKDPHFFETIHRNKSLYKHICNKSQKKIIIDSSKDITRLYYLFRSGDINIFPIFLVRDGRAYINSLKKRLGMTAFRSMLRWIRLNLISQWFLKKILGGKRLKNKNFVGFISDSFVHLSYEDLTLNSEKVLKDICEKLGLEYEDGMLFHADYDQHTISGTKRDSRIGKISHDKTWEGELPFMSKMIFAFMGGNYWNRRFGVNNKTENL